MRTLRMGIFSLLVLLLGACTSHGPSTRPYVPSEETQRLDRLLRTLPGADPAEARRLAREAVTGSLELRRSYRVAAPPLWHNALVNLGIRERGLCWHWADDLYIRIRSLGLRSFRILPVGAHIGDYWREHNALAVLPARPTGFPLDRAVLLDPWRGGGRLFFGRVGSDPEYRWSVRRDRLENATAKEKTPSLSAF